MNELIKREFGEFNPRQFRPKGRTKDYHPSVFRRPVNVKDKRSEINYFAQLLSWELGNKHTFHLQENIQFVVDTLNFSFSGYARYKIIGNSVRVPYFRVWTATQKFTFDLSQGEFDKCRFVEIISELVGCQSDYEF